MRLEHSYDEDADVLYLTVGDDPPESECEETPEGVTLRYSADDHRPVGAIIVGYQQYGWPHKSEFLADFVARRLTDET